LIIFLHGGGFYTARDAAKYTLEPQEDSSTGRSSRMLSSTGMITVGPSAPGKYESWYRWCLRASEEYLADVIAECKRRFNIDSDRVFLLGHSMGGFGAFHHAQRQPDRFAAIIAASGAWDWGYWPVLRGTPMAIVSGVNDAQRGERWHHTDVEYGRHSHRIFEREKLEHKYYEHEGEHGFGENRASVADYFASTRDLRRDPYYPRVSVATPQGFTYNYMHRVRHNRWLTLDEATSGEIRVDELVSRGDDFDEWRLEHHRTLRKGAAVEAINQGDNRIDVTTQNVARLTVWLHPRMVDLTRPVTIHVDDNLTFSARLQPSLVTALESYERRHDWGLIYPVKVELNIRGD
jgi:pimeloyl-ACP methyl ester carboxylesterase